MCSLREGPSRLISHLFFECCEELDWVLEKKREKKKGGGGRNPLRRTGEDKNVLFLSPYLFWRENDVVAVESELPTVLLPGTWCLCNFSFPCANGIVQVQGFQAEAAVLAGS